MNLEVKLIKLGNFMQNLAYKLMPFSFIFYFIVKLMEVKWKIKPISKLVKSLWYLIFGIASLDGDVRAESLATMIVFFDAFDSFIEYKLEVNN